MKTYVEAIINRKNLHTYYNNVFQLPTYGVSSNILNLNRFVALSGPTVKFPILDDVKEFHLIFLDDQRQELFIEGQPVLTSCLFRT